MMAKGPEGEKRPADVIGNAVRVMRIATGEISETIGKAPNRAKGAKPVARSGGPPFPVSNENKSLNDVVGSTLRKQLDAEAAVPNRKHFSFICRFCRSVSTSCSLDLLALANPAMRETKSCCDRRMGKTSMFL